MKALEKGEACPNRCPVHGTDTIVKSLIYGLKCRCRLNFVACRYFPQVSEFPLASKFCLNDL